MTQDTQDNASQPGRKPLRPIDCPTPEQFAADAGVSTETVRRWIREGQLVAYRVGKRRLRVDPSSMAALMTPR